MQVMEKEIIFSFPVVRVGSMEPQQQCTSKHWKTGEPCVLSEFETLYDLEQAVIGAAIARRIAQRTNAFPFTEIWKEDDAVDMLIKARET